jgi:hypothetical protein
MDSGGINQNTVGNAVWTTSPRGLTNWSPLMNSTTITNQTLAAAATIDLRVGSAGLNAWYMISCKSAAGTGLHIRMIDGTNTFETTGAAGTAGGISFYVGGSDNIYGPQIQNTDGAQTGIYTYNKMIWTL